MLEKAAGVFILCASSVIAADVNLLNNPDFVLDRSGFPADWCFRRAAAAKVSDVAVPGSVAFHSPEAGVHFKQGDIHLVPGRKYRFGAEVKTAGVTAGSPRLVVYNYAWTKDSSLPIPADTRGEWKKIKHEFIAPESRDELYSYAIYMKAGAKGEIAVRAPFLTTGTGHLNGEERAPIFSDAVKTVKAPIPAAEAGGKRLNALVRRLLTARAGAGEVAFETGKDGWIWIACDAADNKARILVDGTEAGAVRVGGALEAMRRVAKGMHTVAVENGGNGVLIVNAIPAILATSYPDARDSGAPRLVGAFTERFLYPAINTFSYGWAPKIIPEAERRMLRARGRELYGQLCRWNKNTPGFNNRMEPSEQLAGRFRKANGMAHPEMDGLNFDEISASALLEKIRYTDALRLSTNLPRPLWTWSSGVDFENNGVNADYLSAVAAAAGGRGRLLFECYAVTPPDEKSAEAYLCDFLDGSVIKAEKMVPGFVCSSMIVNGCYTQLGTYCTDCRVQADVKRFWDMYFHRLATSPVFEGLAGVGIYAINRAQEEDLRWTLELIRHYCLKGDTAMLSEKYGFTYNPGLIRNPDFADGLDGWIVEPAEEGSLCGDTVRGFASMQVRKDAGAGGDTVCLFRRSAKKPNVLKQKIIGLKPGRLYSVRYIVADAQEITARKGSSRTFTLTASIIGAEDITASAPAVKWGEALRVTKCVNERTLVFRAKSPTAELVFSDWLSADRPGGEAGEELVVNAVRVKPYYN